jgi:hypothetical protein
MSDGVTLANILGTEVSIQWYEAVALVREVADRLLSVSTERAVPELQQVRLSPEGHIDILGVMPANDAIASRDHAGDGTRPALSVDPGIFRGVGLL